MLVSLFIVTAVGLMFGPGYTRYTEAQPDPARRNPHPNLVTKQSSRLSNAAAQTAAWSLRYREHW